MAFEAHALLTSALFSTNCSNPTSHNRTWETDAYAWLKEIAPTAPPPPIVKKRGRKSRETRNLHHRLHYGGTCTTSFPVVFLLPGQATYAQRSARV